MGWTGRALERSPRRANSKHKEPSHEGKRQQPHKTRVFSLNVLPDSMIQERYGYARERARKEIEEWYRSVGSSVAEHIESLRSGIQNLSSTVERIAKEQLPHARSRTTEALSEAEDAVKRNPLSALAIALGLGFLIDVFTRR